jgi:hypothetical protein
MSPSKKVEIIDRDNWRKEFPLEKSFLHIGGDVKNDIVLEARRGGGVAPRPPPRVAMPGAPGFRAINLSDRDILVGESGGRSFPPRSAMDIVDGDCLHLGDFTLVFHLGPSGAAAAAIWSEPEPVPATIGSGRAAAMPAAAGEFMAASVEKASSHIGLRLSLPQAAIEPDQPLEGLVAVHNLGSEPGVQFRLQVDGLDPDCYEIGPGPILFPNVEKGVYLRLHHPKGPGLAAGRHQIQIHASAPDAYPGEQVSVSREIEILPYYRHTLTLVVMD